MNQKNIPQSNAPKNDDVASLWRATALTDCLIVLSVLLFSNVLNAHEIERGSNVEVNGLAQTLLEISGFKGGLCIHLACGEGGLTTELGRSKKFVVQGLEHNAEVASKARAYIQSQLEYGRVSLWKSSYQQLPHADNLVNVVVLHDIKRAMEGKVNFQEVYRILCPGGTLVFTSDEQSAPIRIMKKLLAGHGFHQIQNASEHKDWYTARKPISLALDEWTHFRHGPDGNVVSKDTVVAPPNDLRWLTGTRFGKLALTPMLAAGGRFFAASKAEGLTARNAYNGILLWQRKDMYMWSKGHIPMVATRKHVYALRSGGKKKKIELVALDATTGAVLITYKNIPIPTQMLFYKTRLFLNTEDSIICIEAESGKINWKFSGGNGGMVIGDESLYFLTEPVKGKDLIRTYGCLDLQTGKERWKKTLEQGVWPDSVVRNISRLSLSTYQAGGLAFSNSKQGQMIMVNAKDGAFSWHHDSIKGSGGKDIYFVDGLWWINVRKKAKRDLTSTFIGLDPKTGAVVKSFPVPRTRARCFVRNATTKYKFCGDFETIGFEDGLFTFFPPARGGCKVGFIPANGLLLVPSNTCACGTFLGGTFAVEANTATQWKTPIELRFEKGSAWTDRPKKITLDANLWPHYRHDAQRSASTASVAPKQATLQWSVRVGKSISGCTASHNLVFIAVPEEHRIMALEAHSGALKWQFMAGGRIDSPPTLYKGYCLFGARDGWVYCLRADTGILVWRYQAAPGKRLITYDGQLESSWPVHGSVVVDEIKDRVYFAAGRNSGLKGGVWMYAAVPETGEIIWKQQIIRGASGKKYIMPMDCTLLKSDGEALFLGHGKSNVIRLSPADGKVLERLSNNRNYSGLLIGKRTNVLDEIGKNGRLSSWEYEDVKAMLIAFNAKRIVSVKNIRTRTSSIYKLFSKARNSEKNPGWETTLGMTPKALVLAKETTIIAGVIDANESKKNFLQTFDTKTGTQLKSIPLKATPVWNGVTVTNGRIYIATQDGSLNCFAEE